MVIKYRSPAKMHHIGFFLFKEKAKIMEMIRTPRIYIRSNPLKKWSAISW